jgi:ATP-dependent Lhr-like helicase
LHVPLDHLSPFSVSVIVEIGRQRAPGESAADMILEDAESLIAEARV